MTPTPTLEEALTNLASAEQELASLSLEHEPDSRVLLVKARRRMAEQMGVVGPLIEREPEIAADPDRLGHVTRHFSAFRTQLAMHQADWPVIRVEENPLAYRDSALAVREKAGAFWTTCKDIWGIGR